jgi:hypothetical protein
MATIGNLTVDLRANTAKFMQGMDRAANRTKKLQKNAKALSKTMVGLTGTVLTLAGVGGIGALVKSQINLADSLGKTSEKLGVQVEKLSALHFAVSQTSEVTDKQFNVALQRMVRRLEDADKKGGEVAKQLESIGLNVAELNALSPDEAFLKIADAMQKTEEQGTRVKTAFALFDTEGVNLVNTLQKGSEEITKLTKEAAKLGLVLDTQTTKESAEFNDEMDKLGKLFGAIGRSIATVLLPPLIKVVKWMNALGADISISMADFANEVRNASGAIEEMAALSGQPILPTVDLTKAGNDADAWVDLWQKALGRIPLIVTQAWKNGQTEQQKLGQQFALGWEKVEKGRAITSIKWSELAASTQIDTFSTMFGGLSALAAQNEGKDSDRAKRLAKLQIVASTAAAVMRAYEQLGPVAGSIASVGVLALGKAQLSAVDGGNISGGGAVQGGASLGGGGFAPQTTGFVLGGVTERAAAAGVADVTRQEKVQININAIDNRGMVEALNQVPGAINRIVNESKRLEAI